MARRDEGVSAVGIVNMPVSVHRDGRCPALRGDQPREYLFRERGIPRALIFPVGPPPATRNCGYDLVGLLKVGEVLVVRYGTHSSSLRVDYKRRSSCRVPWLYPHHAADIGLGAIEDRGPAGLIEVTKVHRPIISHGNEVQSAATCSARSSVRTSAHTRVRRHTGISRRHLACLIEKLAVPWQAGLEGRRRAARGGARKRAAGAGARHQLVFVDLLVATLIHLRHDLPHSVLGLLFGVDRSTITRVIAEVRTLLAERGCAVPDHPGLRLRTLTDVFAYAQVEGIELRLDATEVQVRRPPAGRGGRRASVSGKKKQNTMKATVIADRQGRT